MQTSKCDGPMHFLLHFFCALSRMERFAAAYVVLGAPHITLFACLYKSARSFGAHVINIRRSDWIICLNLFIPFFAHLTFFLIFLVRMCARPIALGVCAYTHTHTLQQIHSIALLTEKHQSQDSAQSEHFCHNLKSELSFAGLAI
jgi:hypothetical protein